MDVKYNAVICLLRLIQTSPKKQRMWIISINVITRVIVSRLFAVSLILLVGSIKIHPRSSNNQ